MRSDPRIKEGIGGVDGDEVDCDKGSCLQEGLEETIRSKGGRKVWVEGGNLWKSVRVEVTKELETIVLG